MNRRGGEAGGKISTGGGRACLNKYRANKRRVCSSGSSRAGLQGNNSSNSRKRDTSNPLKDGVRKMVKDVVSKGTTDDVGDGRERKKIQHSGVSSSHEFLCVLNDMGLDDVSNYYDRNDNGNKHGTAASCISPCSASEEKLLEIEEIDLEKKTREAKLAMEQLILKRKDILFRKGKDAIKKKVRLAGRCEHIHFSAAKAIISLTRQTLPPQFERRKRKLKL